jgi:hypothetical protein
MTKTNLRKAIQSLKIDLNDPCIATIIKQDNCTYFKHRAIEAIQTNDYQLACKLLVILIAKDQTC